MSVGHRWTVGLLVFPRNSDKVWYQTKMWRRAAAGGFQIPSEPGKRTEASAKPPKSTAQEHAHYFTNYSFSGQVEWKYYSGLISNQVLPSKWRSMLAKAKFGIFMSLLTKWVNTWLKMLSYNVTLSINNNRQVGIAAGTNIWGQDMPVGWQQLLDNKEQFTLFCLLNPAQFTLFCLKPRVN